MYEHDLRRIPPFDRLPVQPTGAAGPLLHPDDPDFQELVYEAAEAAVVRDLLTDPQLVPKGTVWDERGRLRAVFWQHRIGRAG